ncbi:MAG: AAA family ATPase [Chloroflexota bacterium]|nr:AAA family ATPase [Chloroflexota bacterium]
MRITKISVKGLFGMFDHEIPLNRESRITIVHGPNGVGKTVLMRMVYDLFNGEYEVIAQTHFADVCIEFENGSEICVLRSADSQRLTFRYEENANKDFGPIILELPFEDYGSSYNYFMNRPEWIKRIRTETKTELIHTFRLQKDFFDDYGLPTIESYDLRGDSHEPAVEKLINDSLQNYAYKGAFEISQTNVRLLELILSSRKAGIEIVQDDVTEINLAEGLTKRYPELGELWESLEGIIEDWDLMGFDDYINELLLFLDIINERILFKSLDLFETRLQFIFKADNGDDIPLSALSSGEQHLFILYFQLLFIIPPNTLVMIDEPELSMNVVWQRNFLKDLQRIVELRKFDVLIATHSPQIIHDKWDWVVHLGEKVDD